jgi:alkanesulfonate monooxygenase SsuD/methylene tetrahydromethanopterin reductase-like flavin-dependent oxidoreductase (luciferase family)
VRLGLWYVESPFVSSHEREAGVSEELIKNFYDEVLLAEKYSFEEVMSAEHHFSGVWWPSPLLVAFAAAMKTTRIKVGTSIALIPLYSPVRLAEDAAIVDYFSKGRLILGVGQGYRPPEFDAFAAQLKLRGRRIEEGVKIIRKLWTEKNVTISSKYWPGVEVRNETLVPQPFQKPRPPIWIAGWAGEKGIRRAARLVATGEGLDRWFADTLGFPEMRKMLPFYIDELRKFGKEYNEETAPVLMNEGYVSGSAETAWEEVKPHLMLTYQVYQEWAHYPPDLTGKTTERNRDYTRLKLEEVVTTTVKPRMILGSPDDCIKRIEEWRKEFKINHFVLRLHQHGLTHEKIMEQIRIFGTKVIPYFKDQDKD